MRTRTRVFNVQALDVNVKQQHVDDAEHTEHTLVFIAAMCDPRFKKLRFKHDRMLSNVMRARAVRGGSRRSSTRVQGQGCVAQGAPAVADKRVWRERLTHGKCQIFVCLFWEETGFLSRISEK